MIFFCSKILYKITTCKILAPLRAIDEKLILSVSIELQKVYLEIILPNNCISQLYLVASRFGDIVNDVHQNFSVSYVVGKLLYIQLYKATDSYKYAQLTLPLIDFVIVFQQQNYFSENQWNWKTITLRNSLSKTKIRKNFVGICTDTLKIKYRSQLNKELGSNIKTSFDNLCSAGQTKGRH